MEIGTEISQKIRSAIKAKLIELGAYVDDELPDYIMVMVANKKTQQQMTDDLSLFLGGNTEKFTAWLHSLLKKLQSINSEQPAGSKDKHKQKHDKSGKQDKPDKQDKSDKTKSVKRKKSHSEKDKSKSSDSGKHRMTSEETNPPDSATKVKRHSTDSGDTVEVSSQKRKLPAETGDSSDVTKQKKSKSGESSKGDKAEVKKAVVVPAKQEKKEGDEEKAEINITENTDEFSEEVKVDDKKEGKKAGKAAPAKGVKVEKDVSKQKTSKTKDKAEKTKVEEKSKESSKHKPLSVVGTVKRKFVDEDELEEEYDPLNPAVSTVASVIRGPARKSSVPKSLQANRSLLMKAVSDAEKSVADLKKEDVKSSKPVQKVPPSDLRGRLKTAAALQLVSKLRRKEPLESMTYTVDNTEKSKKSKSSKSLEREAQIVRDMKLVVKNEDAKTKKKVSPKSKAPAVAPARVAQEALRSLSKNKPIVTKTIQQDDDDLESLEEEEYGPPLPDSRFVRHTEPVDQDLSPQLSENNQSDADIVESNQSDVMSDKPPSDNMEEFDHVTDPEIQQLLDDDDEDYTLQLDSDQPRARSTTPKDPKFIVTLDGVDPQTYEVISEHRPQYVQTVKPSPKYPVVPVQPIETQIVKQEEIPKPESPVYSKITPPKIKPFNISLKDTDDEDEGEGGEGEEAEGEPEEETAAEVKQPSVLERCRFWPACANGNDCQYIHPSVPCKIFPYCKFGDKCVYIHPNCKYDAKCTRMDCPFTHATRRPGGFTPTVIHQYVPIPLQQPRMPIRPLQSTTLDCRFYPNCHNMSCPFNHPKPCRFGISCANKATCRFYHPPLPTKDKMKWSAGDLTKLDTQAGDGDKMISRSSSSSL